MRNFKGSTRAAAANSSMNDSRAKLLAVAARHRWFLVIARSTRTSRLFLPKLLGHVGFIWIGRVFSSLLDYSTRVSQNHVIYFKARFDFNELIVC